MATFPDDSQKDLAAVLSYMAGRTLSKEEIWKAMEIPRSTYYDRLEKGTLITADNLSRTAMNLGINRAELLTRYRLIDPAEIASLAEVIGVMPQLPAPTPINNGAAKAKKNAAERASVSKLPRRGDAPPL